MTNRHTKRAAATAAPRNRWDLAAREFFRRAGKRGARALVMVSVSETGQPDLIFKGDLRVAAAAIESVAQTLRAFAASGPVPETGANDGMPSAGAP